MEKPDTVAKESKNNRMPGNIVCGICGAVRFYAFIMQAKKFGTFSCEPCRKFVSKTIKMCQDDKEDDELFPCLTATGQCVVPPVLPRGFKKPETNRCQACWLKLCLLGYTLENDLYDMLRSRLPIVFHDLLPDSGHKNDLLTNRGEILEFKRQMVPLSRPLFDGFGDIQSDVKNESAAEHSKVKMLQRVAKNVWIF